MTSPGRYRNEPADIVEQIARLQRRVEVLEANPRAGNTTIDAGALRVRDAAGSVRTQVGLLSDNTYGIEVKETGQDNFHQIPYVFAEQTIAFEGTTSSTYTDLTTIGPTVTVPVRSTGRVLAVLSMQIQWPAVAFLATNQEGGQATVDITGANTIIPTVAENTLITLFGWSWTLNASFNSFATPGTFADTWFVTNTAVGVFDHLNQGNTTFRAKYRSIRNPSATAEFGKRTLAVFAL